LEPARVALIHGAALQLGGVKMPEALIETGIGVLFVFMVMSLIVSQLVEWLAAYQKWRARNLEATVRSMLFDPAVKAKIDQGALVLADQLYAHPLIASLAQPKDRSVAQPKSSRPSYIPASKFATALFDVIMTAGTDTSTIGRARAGLEQIKNQLLATLPAAAGPELQSLIDQIQALINQAIPTGQANTTGQVDATIAALPLPPLLNDELNGFLKRYAISPSTFNTLIQSLTTDSDILLNQILGGAVRLSQLRPELSQAITNLFSGLDTQLAQGETRLAAARRNVEQWFDDTMDRASGWYKRHTQLWLGIVGFAVALMLNVDTITIATTLWRDPTLRQNVVEQAQKYQPTTTASGQPIANPDQAAQAIRDLSAKLSQDLRLPIGWRIEAYALQANETCTLLPLQAGQVWGLPNGANCIRVQEAVPNPGVGLISKLMGLIITAAAVTQGAPFWFDLLQKTLRLAGKKPE
jgi:hypothetical protein